MIEGDVNDGLEPIIAISLKHGDALTTIQAVVDTGFSGDLCLAEQYADQIDMAFEFAEPYELANGDVVVEDVFGGVILFNGRQRDVHFMQKLPQTGPFQGWTIGSSVARLSLAAAAKSVWSAETKVRGPRARAINSELASMAVAS